MTNDIISIVCVRVYPMETCREKQEQSKFISELGKQLVHTWQVTILNQLSQIAFQKYTVFLLLLFGQFLTVSQIVCHLQFVTGYVIFLVSTVINLRCWAMRTRVCSVSAEIEMLYSDLILYFVGQKLWHSHLPTAHQLILSLSFFFYNSFGRNNDRSFNF